MKQKQKYYWIIGIVIIALILIIVYIQKSQIKSPEEKISLMLTDSWTLTIEENKIPAVWSGEPVCKLIILENPSEKYENPFAAFGNYTAFHEFWFCPKGWNGTQKEIPPMVQEYPASLLCDCKDYKIFHFSIGENSQKDWPDRVKEEFSK